MAGVVAKLIAVDEKQAQYNRTIALRVAPMPGDNIKLADGTVLRVLRRQVNELADDSVDIELGVRNERFE